MEMETSTQSSEVSSAAPSAVSEVTSQPAADTTLASTPATASASGTSVETAGAAPSAATTWNPDWKFKANGQEYEIDEEYRPYVKGPEDEKRIKRMFEQFKGVEKLKADRDELKTKYSSADQELGSYKKGFEVVEKLFAEGQYKKAFELLKFSPQVVYKAALQFAEFDELPQQQKEVYHQLQQQEQYNQMLAQQNHQAVEQLNRIQTQARDVELTQVLSSPEVKSVAEKFDQAYGPGSFRNAVIQRGQQYWAATQQDLSAQQVVEDLLKVVKPFQAQQAASAPAAPSQPRDVPVIPATGSASGTPVGKTFQSLEELKNYGKQKFGY